MKVVFVGPTLPEAASLAPGLDIRAPAIQGDLYRAVEAGATAIGLVDGGFEYTAPVWHKEILYALSEGVAVFGAASMGALRAAECHAFGMIPIGTIARDYCAGILIDDADVAQLHAPQDLGWASLTEPLVNVLATLRSADVGSRIAPEIRSHLEEIARDLHFKERTWQAILRRHAPTDPLLRQALLTVLTSHAVNLKRQDALSLLDALSALPPARSDERARWTFNATSLWRDMLARQRIR